MAHFNDRRRSSGTFLWAGQFDPSAGQELKHSEIGFFRGAFDAIKKKGLRDESPFRETPIVPHCSGSDQVPSLRRSSYLASRMAKVLEKYW